MTTQNYRLGVFAMVAIVALRLGIGMHFYSEGAKKLQSDSTFTSRWFLEGAKGPLAPAFQSMVWDREGRHRLGYALDEYQKPIIDVTPTLQAWDQFRTQVVDHYGLDEEQRERAQAIVADYEEQLKYYLGLVGDKRSNAEGLQRRGEIIEYFHGLERSAANQAQPVRRQVRSLWWQTQQIESEMESRRNGWLSTIDGLWSGLEADLNALGDASAEPPQIRRLGRRPLDSVAIDKIIPWFDLTVGALLIVGLFTRLAALAGGLFLASVCLSQWPTALGAQPVWYQAIEMLACFVLVGLAAGRIAGLDAILHNLRMWCCPPKENSDPE